MFGKKPLVLNAKSKKKLWRQEDLAVFLVLLLVDSPGEEPGREELTNFSFFRAFGREAGGFALL